MYAWTWIILSALYVVSNLAIPPLAYWLIRNYYRYSFSKTSWNKAMEYEEEIACYKHGDPNRVTGYHFGPSSGHFQALIQIPPMVRLLLPLGVLAFSMLSGFLVKSFFMTANFVLWWLLVATPEEREAWDAERILFFHAHGNAPDKERIAREEERRQAASRRTAYARQQSSDILARDILALNKLEDEPGNTDLSVMPISESERDCDGQQAASG